MVRLSQRSIPASIGKTLRSRQRQATTRSAICPSSVPSGRSSVISARRKPSNSCSSSLGRTMSLARSPCLSAFELDLDLPFVDFGPVLFNAFRRFASVCSWLVILESFILFRPSCLNAYLPKLSPKPHRGTYHEHKWVNFSLPLGHRSENTCGDLPCRDNGHAVVCPSISAF